MKQTKNEFKNILIPLSLCIIVSIYVFSQFGVKHVNDSHRYLDYASNLENGLYFEEHNRWYLGYVFFIFIVRALTNSYSEFNLIIAQYLYSLVGLVFLCKTINIFQKDHLATFIGGFLYLVFIEICIWNSYILCESFYFNNIVIAFYFLSATALQNKYTPINILLTAFFTILTAISKPTGVVVLLALAITAYAIFWLNPKVSRNIKIITLLTASLLFVVLLNNMLETYIIIENYELGEIVYAASYLPEDPKYSTLTHPVPALNKLPQHYPPLVRILHFILFNPGFWFSLFFKKIGYFLLHVRPYWSFKHNLFNILSGIPIYVLAFRQIMASRCTVKIFAITYISLHTLIVGTTIVDWDGRFFLPLIPVLIIFASQQINKLRQPLLS